MSALRTLRRKLKSERDRRHQTIAGLRLDAKNALLLIQAGAARDGMTAEAAALRAQAEAVLAKGRKGLAYRRHIPFFGKSTIHATKGRVWTPMAIWAPMVEAVA